MKDKINRLISLAGSDGGFYALAIRSFIEHYMRNHFPGFDDSWTITFNTNLYNYKKYLIERNPGTNLVELSSFKGIMDMNSLIEDIYHNFASISNEEVRAVTFNFLQFCRAAGIDEDLLWHLKTSLEHWEHRKTRSEDLAELTTAREELNRLKKENTSLLKQYRELEELKAVRNYLESRMESLRLEMEKEKQGREKLASELDELKKNRNELGDKISSFGSVDRYLKNLLRVSLYSRTRMDYERSLTELTDEQKEVLSSITLKSDFLVKGGAGTGKTLILLEAMRQANEGVLAFASKKLLLLTFTNTLVKYDRYISGILKMEEGESKISTADSYLNSLFEEDYPDLSIDYNLAAEMCGKAAQSVFTDSRQLQREIEDFLWGYGITKEEYIDRRIRRKGLKHKLTLEQRREIWSLKEKMEEEMLKGPSVSKAFSRILLLERVVTGDFDHIFIDESQDLSPVELLLLKKLSLSSVVMAGDTDQSIYGIGAPYQRAGAASPGNTKILKANFRNSIPIHDLAEDFRNRGGVSIDSDISPAAFREGPSPELYLADETEELYDQLVEKVKIFLNTIEYDRENLCILAPGARFLDKIAGRLEREGIGTVNIKNPDFDFSQKGNVRLSPLHSSKGIDMPVVLLFIPTLFYNRELNGDEAEILVRNLIYVSMTRAMENLNIFTKSGTSDRVLKDLIELME